MPLFIKTVTAVALGTTIVMGSASAAQPPPQSSRRQAAARLPGAISVEEATELTNGWALLAQGLVAQAATRAARVLASYPRNVAALALAVEAEIARGGASAGLSQYERWLGQRTIEEPGILRRVAHAQLHEEAADRQDPSARLAAIRGLTDDGDTTAVGERAQIAAGGAAENRALASFGDERAVRILIADLAGSIDNKAATIDALGASGSPLAVPALMAQLGDPRQEVRGAAIEALGKTGGPDVVPRITAMLSDGSAYVRMRAAGALFRLGDYGGLPLLQQLMTEESAAARLFAAEAMSSRPDASWMAFVRELTAAQEPEIRAAAGGLIAPHDPELALAVLEPLLTDENAAIRELASQGLGDIATNDLTTLRRLLKNGFRLTRVRAASRVLSLTR